MNMHTHTIIERDGLTAKIMYDPDPSNPREWNEATVMACFHRNYRLGDDHSFSDTEELQEFVNRKDVVALPLYLYDHSGITMSTAPFSCGWDSGQVGYIYMTLEQAREMWGWKNITKSRRAQIIKYLEGDVDTYDQYLTGDVYGYVIEDADREELESCWGFYGIDDVESQVNSLLDHYEATLPKQFELSV